MLNALLHAFMPGVCILCDCLVTSGPNHQPQRRQPELDLCNDCRTVLPWNHGCCERCALPMRLGQTRCANCSEANLPFRRVVAPLLHEGHPRQWVHQTKYHRGMVEARLLGTLLGQCLVHAYTADELPDAVVPVPLSWRRLARRGHNQAILIALHAVRMLKLPLYRAAVSRRHGPRQQSQYRQQREANVSGVFRTGKRWQGKRLAVVDDVMTTGSTASALSQTLLSAGAVSVDVWCATRA